MSKYSREMRINVIKFIVEENNTAHDAAKSFGINRGQILKWLNLYRKHGLDGLCNTNKSYPGDFKIHVVESMHRNHWSIRHTAAYFCIPQDTTVGKWERIYYEEGPEALNRDNRGRPHKNMEDSKKKPLPKKTEEDLISENQRLRMENEFLKKKIEIRERMMEEKRQKKSSLKQ